MRSYFKIIEQLIIDRMKPQILNTIHVSFKNIDLNRKLVFFQHNVIYTMGSGYCNKINHQTTNSFVQINI